MILLPILIVLLLAFGIGATAPWFPWNHNYYRDHYRALARRDRKANR